MIRVYGDIMLDKWIIGNANRISPEAPVPVLHETEQKHCPGGAGNIAINIASLNENVGVYGTIAPDYEGNLLAECFRNYEKIAFNVTTDSKITTTKNRLVGQGGQHILRWDREEKYQNSNAFKKLLADVQSQDVVCVSDYNKGTIQKNTISDLLDKGCTVLVDPKQDAETYRGAFLVKPNMKEYNSWFGEFKKENAILKLKEYNWTYLVVTDGANGIHVLKDDLTYRHYQEPAQEVADVVGAGDTVLAVLAYYIGQGIDVFKACEIACYASARSVEHRGIHVITHDDLKRKVVFTNGCFDILHTGHFRLLEFAKSKGIKLVVGINSDASVKRLKGNNRPVNNQEVRKEQLEALPWVDNVVIFEEDTPENILKIVNPDLIIKGGDYIIEQVVGHKNYPVEIFPTIQGRSTSNIIENIK